MNTPLRRVAMAVMVMVVALLANATYVQVIKADDLRADPRNSRVLLDEYSRQRGQISASGQVLAASRATDDRYKYLREYPNPYPYAPVTGFYSMQYGSAASSAPRIRFSTAQTTGCSVSASSTWYPDAIRAAATSSRRSIRRCSRWRTTS
ncbi:hypothetical protein GCM10020255_040250 [Rhodococcus baikonurensis]